VEYRDFLRSTLPSLGLRWRRFRGKAVRRRLAERLRELKLSSMADYRAYVLSHPGEQRHLSSQLTITISRFWRDAELFTALQNLWLPAVLGRLTAGQALRIWSAGCAGGEEPYSLLILWAENFTGSGHQLQLLASDVDRRCLERAKRCRYGASSLREMPKELRRKYCTNEGETFSLSPGFQERVHWVRHNLLWDEFFPDIHLIFCRNLVYTYFTEEVQQEITCRFHRALVPGGLLVVGRKDRLPPGTEGLFRQAEHPVYQRLDTPDEQ
jgi:chemotaxis protein methyltransferase CheR